MEKKIEHTPTPWIVEANVPGHCNLGTEDLFTVFVTRTTMGNSRVKIAVCENLTLEDAAFIVRAVNVHDELVAAAQNARNVLAALVAGDLKEIKADSPALAMLRAALAKAEGK